MEFYFRQISWGTSKGSLWPNIETFFPLMAWPYLKGRFNFPVSSSLIRWYRSESDMPSLNHTSIPFYSKFSNKTFYRNKSIMLNVDTLPLSSGTSLGRRPSAPPSSSRTPPPRLWSSLLSFDNNILPKINIFEKMYLFEHIFED